jgi:hypothetical protein
MLDIEIEKVTVLVTGREQQVPKGEHSVEKLHTLLLVEAEHVLVLRDGDAEVFLDEVEVFEIKGGERFEKRHHRDCPPVIAKVNRTDVAFPHAKVTGYSIKEQAIKAGLSIKLDFPLFHNEPHGKKVPVGDGQHIRLHRKHPSSFTCLAPDDNS